MPQISDPVRAGALVVLVACAVSLVVDALLRRRADREQGRLLPPLSPADQERSRALATGQPRAALRLLRSRLGIGRAEARGLLDRLQAGERLPATWAEVGEAVDPQVRAEAVRLCAQGRRVQAVKAVRDAVRVRLNDAVHLVDDLAARARQDG